MNDLKKSTDSARTGLFSAQIAKIDLFYRQRSRAEAFRLIHTE